MNYTVPLVLQQFHSPVCLSVCVSTLDDKKMDMMLILITQEFND